MKCFFLVSLEVHEAPYLAGGGNGPEEEVWREGRASDASAIGEQHVTSIPYSFAGAMVCRQEEEEEEEEEEGEQQQSCLSHCLSSLTHSVPSFRPLFLRLQIYTNTTLYSRSCYFSLWIFSSSS